MKLDASKPRNIRYKPDTNQLNGGKDSLKERGQAPAPSVLNVRGGGKRDPGGNDISDKPSGIVDSRKSGTVLRMAHFSDKKRSTA